MFSERCILGNDTVSLVENLHDVSKYLLAFMGDSAVKFNGINRTGYEHPEWE
jgi:hypothetical protein